MTINPNKLKVGESAKDNSDKELLVCENPACARQVEPLYDVQVDKNVFKKYCWSCYKEFYAKYGIEVK